MADKWIARSASDNTDKWPFWFVTRQSRLLNETLPLARTLGVQDAFAPGATLTGRAVAERLAAMGNGEDDIAPAEFIEWVGALKAEAIQKRGWHIPSIVEGVVYV